MHSAIGFGFASHWWKNWRESFKPITKRSNRNHVITFDSHLKTALRTRMCPCETYIIKMLKNALGFQRDELVKSQRCQ